VSCRKTFCRLPLRMASLLASTGNANLIITAHRLPPGEGRGGSPDRRFRDCRSAYSAARRIGYLPDESWTRSYRRRPYALGARAPRHPGAGGDLSFRPGNRFGEGYDRRSHSANHRDFRHDGSRLLAGMTHQGAPQFVGHVESIGTNLHLDDWITATKAGAHLGHRCRPPRRDDGA
jgi:hypothetical protein